MPQLNSLVSSLQLPRVDKDVSEESESAIVPLRSVSPLTIGQLNPFLQKISKGSPIEG